ncbi:MAG: glycyl radical protein [Ruminococcaceae bacterium]|nr:glycyl radical protein [Oscillospiraceae bacterium]
MSKYTVETPKKTDRIDRLKEALFKSRPQIEADRAVLLTQSYMETEGEPMVIRRAKAFKNICENLPVVIRDDELIVGSSTVASKSCQVFPEFSFDWMEKEFDTIANRSADPFYISEDTKKALREVFKYWKGRTTSELATSYMTKDTITAIEHNIFTPGNYFYNGVGHVTVHYDKVLKMGYNGIIAEAKAELDSIKVSDADYVTKSALLEAVIISCNAAITYANRYSKLALEMAGKERNLQRKEELLKIAENCSKVPANGATNFYEACQSFWFVQLLLQTESNGHSISPGRFDQYMYPYYKMDKNSPDFNRDFAQELIDCLWIKFNDISKVRDDASAQGFAGYGTFQNLIAGGQTPCGLDATNDLSFMTIAATMHVLLPQPSFSVRVWNKTPHEFLVKAAELTRTGVGLPAYYNDEVIIPALLSRGLTIEDARDYNIIGCVEPQKSGKTWGWHDAAFFNMCRPLELVFSSGMDNGKQISVKTQNIEDMTTFDEFYDAYKEHMNYMIALMVNANNAIDVAHAERCPLPFLASMLDDCIKRGKTAEQGGAVYNFTGPQGFGIANMADSLFAIRKLVFEDKEFTLSELRDALETNFGKDTVKANTADLVAKIATELRATGVTVGEKEIAQITKTVVSRTDANKNAAIREKILAQSKFGNDETEIDALARDVAYTYTRPLEQYRNPRGGQFQAGLYPVSANVPLGAQTGATPDGRYAYTPVADGVSPSAGRDVHGPTAAANSVSKLDHGIASNGTLFNMKFHPSALEGTSGIESFISLIRGYFDQKGSHVQFNVVSRETLLDAQKNPEKYQSLVVRVAGYSALFTTLSKSLQDDIINRTEQGTF